MLEIGDYVYGLCIDPYLPKYEIVNGYIKKIDREEGLCLYSYEVILIKFKERIKNSININSRSIYRYLDNMDNEIDFEIAEKICGKHINKAFIIIENFNEIPIELVSKDIQEIKTYYKFLQKIWIYSNIKEYIKQTFR